MRKEILQHQEEDRDNEKDQRTPEEESYLPNCEELARQLSMPILLICNGVDRELLHEVSDLFVNDRSKNSEELGVVLHCAWGELDFVYQLVSLIRNTYKRMTVLVPFEAKYAPALFVLGASRTILTDVALLGPVAAEVEAYSPMAGVEVCVEAMRPFQEMRFLRKFILETFQDTIASLPVNRYDSKDVLKDTSYFALELSKFLLSNVNVGSLTECANEILKAKYYSTKLLETYTDLDKTAIDDLLHRLIDGFANRNFVIAPKDLKKSGLNVEVASGNLEKTLIELGSQLDDYEPLIDFVIP